MKKMFLMTLLAFGAVSVSFGDCVAECQTSVVSDCLNKNCKKGEHLKKYPSEECFNKGYSPDTLESCKANCKK